MMSHIGYHWDKDQRCLYFKAKLSRIRVYNFDDPTNQILVDEDVAPIDEDMVEVEDVATTNNQGWGEWVSNHWSPTNYVPPPPEPSFVPPTASTGAFASTYLGPPTYLTEMFNNLEIQNQTRMMKLGGGITKKRSGTANKATCTMSMSRCMKSIEIGTRIS